MFRKVILNEKFEESFGGIISEVGKNGFVVSESKGLLKSLFEGERETIRFHDKNYKNSFKKGEKVVFRVENVVKKGLDKNNVFFGVINTLDNCGFYYGERYEDGFWSNVKGFITASESLEENPFEIGDVVRIEVRKFGED